MPLHRVAHPFWFQSLAAVMGMDWHSSGITTCVMGALTRGLAPLSIRTRRPCLRRAGKHGREAPDELAASAIGWVRWRGDGARAGRLVAKVDSAAVQDGFDLYLHGFIVADDGKWVMVQQGMNGGPQARRYHWLSEGLTNFVDEPHRRSMAGSGHIVNLTDRRADSVTAGAIDILRDLGRIRSRASLTRLEGAGERPAQPMLPI